MPANVPAPVEVFISYSHKDERLREGLETHLSLLKRQGIIDAWHDRRITAGQEWAGAIDEHLDRATVILLLVSADFLASDYCYEREMTRALERHDAGEARVIPIILRPVDDWGGAPFGHLQALPKDGKPVTDWPSRDRAFTDIAKGIRRAIEKIGSQAVAEHSRGPIGPSAEPASNRAKSATVRHGPASVDSSPEHNPVADSGPAPSDAPPLTAPLSKAAQPAASEAPTDEATRRLRFGWRSRWIILAAVLACGGALAAYLLLPLIFPTRVIPPRPDLTIKMFSDCPACPEMADLKPGRFVMGTSWFDREAVSDERPAVEVEITHPFAISRHEVTFENWQACVRDGGCNGYEPDDNGWGRDHRPVIYVSWEDAQAYVAWLSQKTGKAYRLPTEAEWEYACRAGTETKYPFGDAITYLQANYNRYLRETRAVGCYPPNGWGIHDMNGNVWEWVEDVWNDSHSGRPPDGRARLGGPEEQDRVVRGGSWDDPEHRVRCISRNRKDRDQRENEIGFRVALSLSSDEDRIGVPEPRRELCAEDHRTVQTSPSTEDVQSGKSHRRGPDPRSNNAPIKRIRGMPAQGATPPHGARAALPRFRRRHRPRAAL